MEFVERHQKLYQILTKSKKVTSYSTIEYNHTDALTLGLIDIEDSMRTIITQHIPKLYNQDLKPEEIDDLIGDIGEELRHILYHINDCKIFDHLKVGE